MNVCVCCVVLNATCVWYLNSISACFLKWLLRPCEYMVMRVHSFGERSWGRRLAASSPVLETGGRAQPRALCCECSHTCCGWRMCVQVPPVTFRQKLLESDSP